MAVAKKKPADTEGARTPAVPETMPAILLKVQKKDSHEVSFGRE
jgi:hypothetical protein